jgi:hypothetical protein
MKPKWKIFAWALFWAYMIGVFGGQALASILTIFLVDLFGLPPSYAAFPAQIRRASSFMLSPTVILACLLVAILVARRSRAQLVEKPLGASLYGGLLFLVISIGADLVISSIPGRVWAVPATDRMAGATLLLIYGWAIKWTILERKIE